MSLDIGSSSSIVNDSTPSLHAIRSILYPFPFVQSQEGLTPMCYLLQDSTSAVSPEVLIGLCWSSISYLTRFLWLYLSKVGLISALFPLSLWLCNGSLIELILANLWGFSVKYVWSLKNCCYIEFCFILISNPLFKNILLNIYVYVYEFFSKHKNTACSACILLLICVFSVMAIWY